MSSRFLRRNGRKLGVAATAAALGVSGLALGATPASALPGFEFDRLEGLTRIETAVDISQDTFDASDSALIARADLFPDALAGNYLAGAQQDPILLSNTNAVPAATLAELERLGVETVTLLGGTEALSADVEAALEAAGYTVNRQEGTDRYKTAAAIATSQDAATIGETDAGRTAILATGENFPDALAGGPLAYAGSHPLLLTPTATLGADAAGALEELGIEHVLILGGTAAVSPAAEAAVEALGITTERLQGEFRWETATAIAEWAIANAGFSDEHINVATGQKFPDALTGGPHAGDEVTPIILADDQNTSYAVEYLEAHADTLVDGHIYGGIEAVSAAVEATLEAAAQGEEPGIAGTVVSCNAGGDTITFDADDGTQYAAASYAEATDTFVVDGSAATINAFETACTLGDAVTVEDTDDDGDFDVFTLTNQDAPDSGLVGAVGIDATNFSIITTAGTVLETFTYGDPDDTYTVNGAAVSLAGFEAALSLGDTIVTTDTSATPDGDPETYALTNGSWDGMVDDITEVVPGSSVTFTADGVGDDPDLDAEDALFNVTAAEVTAGDQVLTVGGVAATYQQFEDALSAGDTVVYSRTGGVETFALTNSAPVDPSFSGLSDENSDMTLADGTFLLGYIAGSTQDTFNYSAVENFRVNGVVTTINEFEEALVDDLAFAEAVTYNGTTDTLTLTTSNDTGSRAIDDVAATNDDTENDTFNIETAGGLVIANLSTADSYVNDSGVAVPNRYFVNGAEVLYSSFEDYLVDLTDGVDGADAGDTFQLVITNVGAEHRLTTNNSLVD